MQSESTCWDRRGFLKLGAAAAAGLAVGRTVTAGPSSDLAALTLKDASALLRKGGVSPVELTKACLARIERYNSAVNAFITVTADQALAAAREAETEQLHGTWRGPLHGVPIALKDNIDTAGIRTTAASELYKDRIPMADAEVVRRLKQAGAVLLGKLNLHEFAYGGTSSVSYYGAVHNPWALDRVPGGSSGGSAAAVSAGLCFGALGTDTAGSVRIPASYCGVVGLKPTYGRVSIRGVIPLSWSLDHVGPICRSVEDAALLLSPIAGYDASDPTTADVPVPDYGRALRVATGKMRLGVPRTPFFDSLDPDVSRAVEAALGVLGRLAGTVVDVTLPAAPSILAIVGAEVSAYHGASITQFPERYQPLTRTRIRDGAAIDAATYAQALYDMARARREIRQAFAHVDLLVTPTMLGPAPPISVGADPGSGTIRNTSPFNYFGLPTVSIPCGFTQTGLPIGLQISGAPFAESTVLALAHAYEQQTEWHQRTPRL